MKSSFGRSFSTVATILLLALTVLGASFQMLVKEYLTETTVSDLRSDADAIAKLAAAYSIEGSLSSPTNWEFVVLKHAICRAGS